MATEETLARLRVPFPAAKVYQREGPGGKKLDYVAGETILERLLETTPEYSWSGRIVSVDADGRAIVEGHLSVGDKTGYGVGSAKMGADVDSSLKAANTEAIKNAAKNGFGIGLELWNEEHRADIAVARRAGEGDLPALKKAVFDLAKKKLDKKSGAKTTVAEVAKCFGVDPGELSDMATLRGILESEGVL
jgi:hypothetical protein